MAGSDTLKDWLTWSFSPTASAIAVTLLVSLLLPVLIHFYLYRKAASAVLPAFLLIGPSGAGKTTLLTLFSSGTLLPTQTSQEPQSVQCQLLSEVSTSDDQYRSVNDTSSRTQPKFLLIDTPGHGKLRQHATTSLTSTPALKGLLFVVDSAAISSAAGLTETAEYLYDVLLMLQKRHTLSKTTKEPQSIPVLILANKQDVFTSLPLTMVQKKLEDEITKIRLTRSKGVLDSGIGMDGEDADDEEQHWLGEFDSKHFTLAQMEEHGIEVAVLAGSVKGENGKAGNTQDWWVWIGQQL
ncbi:hypothetical protein AMS68_006732 [Peltaster fructicola]|uniref:Signal recognition particle receptor subunit beta n=1 Tax=Peltaster fructicola TaxID=286661 RepID=A0A6H0Y2R8_9PEZI|nr:hypothetical protein AMS68_006732 [Peltaster fructicola]